MVGKRERLARILDTVGLSSAVTSLRKRTPPTWLSVLTYHRVGTTNDELAGDMFDATEAQFEQQIAHLARHFNFIGTEDVIRWIDGRPLPPNPVMVSFDDGYLDNLHTALPILLRHGATATFFIPTDFIERRRLFWWDRISLIVERMKDERIVLDYPEHLSVDREGAPRLLTDVVKTAYGLDLDRFLEHLSDRAGVAIDEGEEQTAVAKLLMTWDDIRELAAAGMDVQSHTQTHRVVQTLRPAQLQRELRGSRELLEERLRTPVRGLAYPVGYPLRGQQPIRDAVAAAGYRVAFSNQTGPINTWRRADPFDLNRMSAYPEASDALFRAIMAVPLLSPTKVTPPAAIIHS